MIYLTIVIHGTAMGLGIIWSVLALADYRFEIVPFFGLVAVSGGMSLVQSLQQLECP